MVTACEDVYFAVFGLEFDALEDVFEHVDSPGVTNEQHLVGQGAAGESYVIEAAVGGKHEFACFHGCLSVAGGTGSGGAGIAAGALGFRLVVAVGAAGSARAHGK